MPIPILMPALSPTMKEGNLVKWHKKEGDQIVSGDILAEIETDKATMEIEAVDEGTLSHILVAEGTESVSINTPIAVLREEDEKEVDLSFLEHLGTPPSVATEKEPEAIKTSLNDTNDTISLVETQRIKASPLAKRIAKERSISLETVKGTGPHGRIIKKDVVMAAPSLSEASATLFEDKKIKNMRKVIAERLTLSKQTAPHFYVEVECVLDRLLTLRKEILPLKLSINDFIIKACALSLRDVPEVNVSWQENVIRHYQHADISVAMSVEGGLVTPVVTHAETRSLQEISQQVKDFATLAKEGKLPPETYTGGTFTLSNLGMFGVKRFSAILNPPQGAILAVGAGEKKPIVKEDGTLGVASIMCCTLSVDHRAIDGVDGARFLRALKAYLENPLSMLI